MTFLLDATLGMISIQQNAIIKIFSVAAVIFLPPTLVASIYGMNFAVMPELDWVFGYPMALVLMVPSAVVSYWVFKIRGWLVGTRQRLGEDGHARGGRHVRLAGVAHAGLGMRCRGAGAGRRGGSRR